MLLAGPLRLAATLLLILTIPVSEGRAQIPSEFRNLQVLPDDIVGDSLIQLMRTFSFATGLRCEGCHVMGENGSFQGAQFHLDDKLTKRQARYMLRMVNRLNAEILPGIPERDTPVLRVECKTCHRGTRKPHLLRTELRAVIDTAGVQAAVARYRELREHAMEEGAYDFGVWEMNELARELEQAGKVAEAVVMLELNEEFHPRDASIPRTLGRLYEALERTGDALAAYARAVGRNPTDRRSLERLLALATAGSP
ncbi:MAG TPA: c-type cytochrome [Gemmatimonadaceae bacterium]|nr:c-type cytochrome [Gemmatimonadaceae bacterium]